MAEQLRPFKPYNDHLSLTDILNVRVKDKPKPFFVWLKDDGTGRTWLPAGNC